MKKINIKPCDFLILFLVIIVSCFLIFTSSAKQTKGSTVKVQANEKTYEYSLEKDSVYELQGLIGATTIEVKNNQVRIIDSACPNKNCIKQGTSTPLVCLPNKIIVTVENYGDFDAFSK
ncbi:MAG: NusG domain II-containing protein [Treponema sp.]|nr:NusG domain II-containing protein [Treponema sp.]